MMTSKEALERLLMLARPCAYEVREHRNSYCDMLENAIKQDLELFEKCKNENCDYQIKNAELQEENEKLKQVIDILKDKFKFELGVSVVKEKYCYSLEFLFNNQYFSITKEEYELVKEVLER